MTNQNWTIKDAEGRAHWLAKDYVPTNVRQQLDQADLLLLPQEGFREFAGPLYPVGTEEFLRSLQQDAPRGLSVDVTVADSDYKELALHADWLILATVFIGSSIFVPTGVGLITEYLKRKIWPEDPKRQVKIKLVIEQRNGDASRSVEASYEGPGNEFEDSLGVVFAELRGRGFPIPSQHEVPRPLQARTAETAKTRELSPSTDEKQDDGARRV